MSVMIDLNEQLNIAKQYLQLMSYVLLMFLLNMIFIGILTNVFIHTIPTL